MRTESITLPISPAIRNGVLVLGGYGIRVAVERRRLVTSDGIGRDRRWGRYPKVTSRLTRLVILGHTGFITFEALRWLHDIGASFAQIDADGHVIAASGLPRLNDARLRRAQALAVSNGAGLRITCDLLREKLRGQVAVLDRLGAALAASELRGATARLDGAGDLSRLRMTEAACAANYWKAWEHLPVRFARRDEPSVPDHWKTFGTRSSPLTGQPRLAANPANALLNYLYGILETEARIACRAMGLDPGIGVLHADQPARDSLALDVMEPTRPAVDAFVIDLLRSRTFSKYDFTETRQGACRLLPPLTHFLAETAPRWARAVAPVAEGVVRTLANKETKQHSYRPVPTPLTQNNRSAGRNRVRRNPRRIPEIPAPRMPQACRNCGVILNGSDRLYCQECFPERRREIARPWLAAGLKALTRLRAGGQDPAHGDAAARKRGKRIARFNRERTRWRRKNDSSHDGTDFIQTILPRLRHTSLKEVALVTGLSVGYCSFIRRGLRVPHPRHWDALRRIE